MDLALSIGLYLVGLISGVLVCMAIMSDRPTILNEPTETGVEPDRSWPHSRRPF